MLQNFQPTPILGRGGACGFAVCHTSARSGQRCQCNEEFGEGLRQGVAVQPYVAPNKPRQMPQVLGFQDELLPCQCVFHWGWLWR